MSQHACTQHSCLFHLKLMSRELEHVQQGLLQQRLPGLQRGNQGSAPTHGGMWR